MERGPVALFGAIVAVGLGPALWLGAQFGHLDATPTRTPTVVSEQNVKAPGGGGAAADEPETEPTRRTRYIPLSGTPSARPSSSATAGADEPAAPPPSKPTASSEPAETDDPTTPPTESTTDPVDTNDPSDGDEDPAGPPPPDPPDLGGGQAAGQTEEG
jgi:hypothetical protein